MHNREDVSTGGGCPPSSGWTIPCAC